MRPISAHRARLLLQLYQPNPTQEEIQQAFLKAAKKYHPDTCYSSKISSSSSSSSSSGTTFRECLEAREILLKQQHNNVLHRFHPSYKKRRSAAAPFSSFAPGFPTRTLRVLSLKQNLALRGMVMISLTLMALTDHFSQKKRFKDEEEEYFIKGIPKRKEVGT